MKKLVAMVVVLFMVAGCATLGDYFCKPTDAQATQAQQHLAAAQAAIAALTPVISLYPPAQAAVVALNLAIPVFNSLVSGVCVSAQQWQEAQDAVNAANLTAKAYKRTQELNSQRAARGLKPL